MFNMLAFNFTNELFIRKTKIYAYQHWRYLIKKSKYSKFVFCSYYESNEFDNLPTNVEDMAVSRNVFEKVNGPLTEKKSHCIC